MSGVGSEFRTFSAAALEDAGLHLRSARPEDSSELAKIYASARIEELARVPWSPEQKKAFTDSQSELQEEHYALHYPRAERLIITAPRERNVRGISVSTIGRLYLETTQFEVRLMDVTLLPENRNQGIGTRILDQLLNYADHLFLQVSLHVEPFNPAKRMYERMGFGVSETRGLYEFLVRRPRDVLS